MVPQCLVLIIWAIVSYGLADACTDLREAPHSRWQTIVQDGMHRLVTPYCERFFSIGVNVLEGGYPQRFPDGRIAYHWETFYPDLEHSGQLARRRLLTWGFNTAGGWSLYPVMLQLPTIPNLELGRTTRFDWFDPFHPTTAEHMRAWGRRLVATHKGTPDRIGYFTHNEVGGCNGALFIYHLEQPTTNHTKQRLTVLLRDHYDDWKRFMRDFVAPPGITSFERLLHSEGVWPQLRPGGEDIHLVRKRTGGIAGYSYGLAHDALREVDPDAFLLRCMPSATFDFVYQDCDVWQTGQSMSLVLSLSGSSSQQEWTK